MTSHDRDAACPRSGHGRRIDLHTHSTWSDGTRTPTQIIDDAAAAGLDVVALTDHDTSAGWSEAVTAAQARPGDRPVALVRGVEISCAVPISSERLRAAGQRVPAGREPVLSVHLLSYLHDPREPRLEATMARTRESRSGRARAIVDRIAVDYPLTWQDVERELDDLESGTTIGRPHIADALVSKGVAHDRSEVFASILRPGSPYFVRHWAPHPVAAVELVRAAGGVPVFAHPGASTRGLVVDDQAIVDMAKAGLAGLEVRHRDNDAASVERLNALAERLGLFVTGSSDYHGAGKPNRLGENTTDERVLARIVAEGRESVIAA